jgi:two-component system OmpR family response regulator
MIDAPRPVSPTVPSLTSHDGPGAGGPGRAEGLQILVADDCADGARSLAILLKACGADARACCSGPEALEAALADPPDALLSEISLPRMDGCELVRRLRVREELRKTLFVAVTGWAGKDSHRLALQAGFDCYYMKPLDHEDLKEILARTRLKKSTTSRGGP